ncbi:large ribosomal subunit protein uL18m [Neocloeon triangulifer]|uniref:large ribosomal subunit protein uL18m n=1 Tax=Neocloeon triangulifer TaxID=2078957 RepID=UPI00286F9038|nr:large ribosomal subunit protein uL18m [Neocloeon triangulifer]
MQRIRQLCPLARVSSSVKFSSSAAQQIEKNLNEKEPPTKSVLNNRNPRNLERLRIAWKPQGYHLEKPGRTYWHKLVLKQSQRHITAQVVHFTGKVVVEASTEEWCIKKHLYNPSDVSAYKNLAKILARRCMEFGLLEMENSVSDYDPETKVGKFIKVVEDEGISLKEPKRYLHAQPFHQLRPEKPWVVTED